MLGIQSIVTDLDTDLIEEPKMDAWKSARDEFHHVVIPKLERIGKEIGRKADAGDDTCKAIIGHYAMLYRSFDPMTLILLKEAITKYEQANA